MFIDAIFVPNVLTVENPLPSYLFCRKRLLAFLAKGIHLVSLNYAVLTLSLLLLIQVPQVPWVKPL